MQTIVVINNKPSKSWRFWKIWNRKFFGLILDGLSNCKPRCFQDNFYSKVRLQLQFVKKQQLVSKKLKRFFEAIGDVVVSIELFCGWTPPRKKQTIKL